MAKKTAMAVRRAPSVPKKRYELAVAAAAATRRRASQVANDRVGVLIGVGTGFLVGHFEKKGKKLPTFGGIEPTALAGAVLAFGPSLFGLKGRPAHIAAESGAAMLGLAAYKAGLGQTIIAGDDDE